MHINMKEALNNWNSPMTKLYRQKQSLTPNIPSKHWLKLSKGRLSYRKPDIASTEKWQRERGSSPVIKLQRLEMPDVLFLHKKPAKNSIIAARRPRLIFKMNKAIRGMCDVQHRPWVSGLRRRVHDFNHRQMHAKPTSMGCYVCSEINTPLIQDRGQPIPPESPDGPNLIA